MKKSEYWQIVRQKLGYHYREHYSEPDFRRPGVIAINGDGLAEYAHDYWKHNGVLPDDYMPILGKEERGQVLRRMWEIVRQDPSFQTAVLDAYEKHYLSGSTDESDAWYHIWNCDCGVFSSTVEAPQLRIIIQKAIKQSKRYRQEKAEVTSLTYLCLEYCRIKWSSTKSGGQARALFNNADILSLISEQGSWTIKDVESTLGGFEEARKKIEIGVASAGEEYQKCFDEDIRPILLGRLIGEAKNFAAWQGIFTFATDSGTKTFALYHMSDKAKSLRQMVELRDAAQRMGMAAVAESARLSWMELCSDMTPEELVKLSSESRIDPDFIEDLILKKCED